MRLHNELKIPDQTVVSVGGEASTIAIRQTLGTFCHYAWIGVLCSSTLCRMLVTMQGVASEINKMKRASSRPLLALWRVTPPLGDRLQRDARSWISPPDPSKNHIIARKIRSGESAVWFTRGRTFDKWALMGGLLWIHGKRT